MENLTIVSNPLVKRDITILRDKFTEQDDFRRAIARLSGSLAVKISERFEVAEKDVLTPLEKTTGHILAKQVVLIPILRAGLSMVDPFLSLIPDAKVGHIGLERNEETLEPGSYYYKTPSDMENSITIVLDPMLATGGSAAVAIDYIKDRGAADIIMACLIAAPEGVEKMDSRHPEIPVYTAALDRQLNDAGYIVPGLGDAGDRTFGTL